MLKKYKEAIKYYKQAINCKKEYTEAYYYRGTTNFMLGGEQAAINCRDEAMKYYKEAIADYKKAIDYEKDFALAKADKFILEYLLNNDSSNVLKFRGWPI